MSSIEIEIEDAPRKFDEHDLEDPRDVILGEGTDPLESHGQPTRGRELMPIDWKIALSDEQLGEEAALMVLGAQRLLAEREADKARQLPKAERAPMAAGDIGGDGQAKAHTAPAIGVARTIQPREWLHRLVTPLHRNARPIILHDNTHETIAN